MAYFVLVTMWGGVLPTTYLTEDDAIDAGSKLVKKSGNQRIRIRSKESADSKSRPWMDLSQDDEGNVICEELSSGKTWRVA